MSEPLAFVSIREIYPNVGNEVQAFRAWMEALREDDAMKILEGTKRYRTWWLDNDTSPAFIPTLAKFLRDRKYRTDPGPSKTKKVWLGSPQPSERRWTASRQNEPIPSKPLSVPAYEAQESPKSFRSAAEILASRRST